MERNVINRWVFDAKIVERFCGWVFDDDETNKCVVFLLLTLEA
jgi:hypothetical protein